jgi:hypothetical protein
MNDFYANLQKKTVKLAGHAQPLSSHGQQASSLRQEPSGQRQETSEQPATRGKGILVIYGANTWGGGVKSTNCVKIVRCPRLVSYNNEVSVRIVKIAKPRR